jgi:hypothetical protein
MFKVCRKYHCESRFLTQLNEQSREVYRQQAFVCQHEDFVYQQIKHVDQQKHFVCQHEGFVYQQIKHVDQQKHFVGEYCTFLKKLDSFRG